MKIPSLPGCSSVVQFPVPESGAAIVSDLSPVLGAFPTGRRWGGVVDIAVPVLLTVGGDDGVPISQAIGEAVATIRKGAVMLRQEEGGEEFLSLMDCRPLANSDRPRAVACPAVRDEFISLLAAAAVGIRERMTGEGGRDTRDVDSVADEVCGIFDLLRLSCPLGDAVES